MFSFSAVKLSMRNSCVDWYTPVNQHSWLEKGPFEDVLPIKDGDIPASYVSLPEGSLVCLLFFHVNVQYLFLCRSKVVFLSPFCEYLSKISKVTSGENTRA